MSSKRLFDKKVFRKSCIKFKSIYMLSGKVEKLFNIIRKFCWHIAPRGLGPKIGCPRGHANAETHHGELGHGRHALLVLQAEQEAGAEQVPGSPHLCCDVENNTEERGTDRAHADDVEAARRGAQLLAEARRQRADVATQHSARLPEQPGAQCVTTNCCLRNLLRQSSELGLVELVVAVTKNPEPDQKKINCLCRAYYNKVNAFERQNLSTQYEDLQCTPTCRLY